MKEPLVVHVYRGEEALGLLVPQRAAGVPRPSRRREHWVAAFTALRATRIANGYEGAAE